MTTIEILTEFVPIALYAIASIVANVAPTTIIGKLCARVALALRHTVEPRQ